MQVLRLKKSDFLVLRPNGLLDANSSALLEQEIKNYVSENESRFVIDFQDLSYVSSAGLRVLMISAKLIQQQPAGELLLCGLNEQVKAVFDISGFTQLFKIHDDLGQAIPEE